MIGGAITLLGAILILLSAVGVVRFPDVLARMQALTKASTLGVVLVAVGSMFVLPSANDITSALAADLGLGEAGYGYVLAGHLHPGVRLHGPGRQSVRLPCFAFGRNAALLPAFSEFTGTAGASLGVRYMIFTMRT